MKTYITIYEYSKLYKIPLSTVYHRIKTGKVKDIKKETIKRTLINKDHRMN